jgi:hypothetical protein
MALREREGVLADDEDEGQTKLVMPGLDPGIHQGSRDFLSDGLPGQARQ